MKVLLLFTLLSVGLLNAAPVTQTPAANSPIATEAKVKKDHAFDDLLVQGKYHFADETVTTVEADRMLDALIGVRKDFKDRLEASDKGF